MCVCVCVCVEESHSKSSMPHADFRFVTQLLHLYRFHLYRN